ncbi:IpaD/SipD/SspD family type III secretion system needle tip protein [Serratia symbiotica]|nr:IpaD/SipD/SspD family type III secretion system needle tip protein [Serratia symbiotica]MBF1996199.1 IpaD/SipD/SspD family type III secretion system needle tip protein [Serratia symbiotica]MBQ0954622.1 IpaD/SipD/SspD family type III secretion system needle tip protein [Serratia symbiotica]QTP14065.1 IpaD/SipD/SspD family type III secretion system needle tip protein [Serratia symbiotica]CDS59044.1 putative type III secretion system effector protein (yspD) [Serratia symbiotica]
MTTISSSNFLPQLTPPLGEVVDNGNRIQAQVPFLSGTEAFSAPQWQDDLYVQAAYLLQSNQHILPLSDPQADAHRGNRMVTPDAEDITNDARQLLRDLKRSEDNYRTAQTNALEASSDEEDVGTPPHIKALEDLIEKIHTKYQKLYAKITEKASQYMKDVNQALGKMSDYINAGKDGKIIFDKEGFLKAFKDSLSKYFDFNQDGSISPKSIHNFTGDDKALTFWKDKLGSGYIVRRGSSGDIEILPNSDAIKGIIDRIDGLKGESVKGEGIELSGQAFQAFQTAIDSQKNTVNNNVSELLERFRQDNSSFETLIQLLQRMTEDLYRYNAGYMNV